MKYIQQIDLLPYRHDINLIQALFPDGTFTICA